MEPVFVQQTEEVIKNKTSKITPVSQWLTFLLFTKRARNAQHTVQYEHYFCRHDNTNKCKEFNIDLICWGRLWTYEVTNKFFPLGCCNFLIWIRRPWPGPVILEHLHSSYKHIVQHVYKCLDDELVLEEWCAVCVTKDVLAWHGINKHIVCQSDFPWGEFVITWCNITNDLCVIKEFIKVFVGVYLFMLKKFICFVWLVKNYVVKCCFCYPKFCQKLWLQWASPVLPKKRRYAPKISNIFQGKLQLSSNIYGDIYGNMLISSNCVLKSSLHSCEHEIIQHNNNILLSNIANTTVLKHSSPSLDISCFSIMKMVR